LLLQTAKAQPVVFYGWIMVAAGFLIELVTYGSMYSFGVFLKPLAHEFGWTRAVTAGVFSLIHAFISKRNMGSLPCRLPFWNF